MKRLSNAQINYSKFAKYRNFNWNVVEKLETIQNSTLYRFAKRPGAEPRCAIGSASGSKARGPGFDTRSSHIILFLLLLIQGGQLSVTGESMCTKYRLGGLSLPRKSVVWLIDLPDMTLVV